MSKLLTGSAMAGRAFLASASLLIPAVANAQTSGDDAAPAEEIVVTGSRIVRSDAASNSPLTVVTAEEIERNGTATLDEVLRRQVAIGNGGVSQSSPGGAGSATIDLRNLGDERTLLLVNGKRIPPFTDGLQIEALDLNLIPSAMVERIEVLRDGASTAYGADAVAGVVNVILKDDFEGVSLAAEQGISSRGDGARTRVSSVFGINSDRGNLTLGLEHFRQKPIRQASRGWARNPVTFLREGVDTIGRGSSLINGIRFTGDGRDLNGDGDVSDPTDAAPAELCIIDGGNQSPCPRYDYSEAQNLIHGLKKTTVTAIGHYDITDEITIFGEFLYGHRDSNLLSPANAIPPGGSNANFPDGFRVPANAYGNTTGQAGLITGRTSFLGNRTQEGTATLARVTAGVRGHFADRYRWEVSYVHADVDGRHVINNVPNLARMIKSADPALCSSDPTCVPIDWFGDLRNLSEAQKQYIGYDWTTDSRFRTRNLLAELSGPIASLPAGELSFALGAEYRKESGENIPDPITQKGESLANYILPTKGSFDVWEAFGELEVPLLKDQPFAQELTVNAQIRYSRFSNFGSDTNYKIGTNWAPVDGLRVRATYGTAFRAPTIIDLYSGGFVSNSTLRDPCDRWGNSTNQTLRANCAAAGVPANFDQGTPAEPVIEGGNPDVEPEQAKTFTIGAVLAPTALPRFQATVDYYKIKITNSISSEAPEEVVNDCYLRSIASACSRFTRNASYHISGLKLGTTNLGETETDGIDFSLGYTFPDVAGGQLSLRSNNSYLLNYITREPGRPADNSAGKARTDRLPQPTFPRLRSNLEVGYVNGDAVLQYTARYIDSMKDPVYKGDNPLKYDGVDAVIYHDLYGSYSFGNVTLGAGVNNLFDKKPPYAFGTAANTLLTTYDVKGRYFFVRASANF